MPLRDIGDLVETDVYRQLSAAGTSAKVGSGCGNQCAVLGRGVDRDQRAPCVGAHGSGGSSGSPGLQKAQLLAAELTFQSEQLREAGLATGVVVDVRVL